MVLSDIVVLYLRDEVLGCRKYWAPIFLRNTGLKYFTSHKCLTPILHLSNQHGDAAPNHHIGTAVSAHETAICDMMCCIDN
jgi:hypothetical protein